MLTIIMKRPNTNLHQFQSNNFELNSELRRLNVLLVNIVINTKHMVETQC